MQVTATPAKTEPVCVENNGRMDTVIVSLQAQFEQSHSAWIAEQNQRFNEYGLWCDDRRVW